MLQGRPLFLTALFIWTIHAGSAQGCDEKWASTIRGFIKPNQPEQEGEDLLQIVKEFAMDCSVVKQQAGYCLALNNHIVMSILGDQSLPLNSSDKLSLIDHFLGQYQYSCLQKKPTTVGIPSIPNKNYNCNGENLRALESLMQRMGEWSFQEEILSKFNAYTTNPGCVQTTPKCKLFLKITRGLMTMGVQYPSEEWKSRALSNMGHYLLQCLATHDRDQRMKELVVALASRDLEKIWNIVPDVYENNNDYLKDYEHSPYSEWCSSTGGFVVKEFEIAIKEDDFKVFSDNLRPFINIMSMYANACLKKDNPVVPVFKPDLSNFDSLVCGSNFRQQINDYDKEDLEKTFEALHDYRKNGCFNNESNSCKFAIDKIRDWCYPSIYHDPALKDVCKQLFIDTITQWAKVAPANPPCKEKIQPFVEQMAVRLISKVRFEEIMGSLREHKNTTAQFIKCVDEIPKQQWKSSTCGDLIDSFRELYIRASFSVTVEEIQARTLQLLENIKLLLKECGF